MSADDRQKVCQITDEQCHLQNSIKMMDLKQLIYNNSSSAGQQLLSGVNKWTDLLFMNIN